MHATVDADPEVRSVRVLGPAAGRLEDLYLDLDLPDGTNDRPYTYLDMVASVDGAATIAGRTRLLGGPADRIAFHRLRETCDAILVGAGTVRVERYGPPVRDPEAQQRRVARGLAPRPRLVVVSGSLSLDPSLPLFDDDPPPLVVTCEQATERADLPAEFLVVGQERVDLAAALAALSARGVRRLLCEGGPTLNAGLFAAGLVDELFLTVHPVVVAGDAPRIVGPAALSPVPLELLGAIEHEGELLLRYRVTGR